MTDSQALLARYHAGELDDNGVLALIDAMQDEDDERAAGYAFVRRWGCVPTIGGRDQANPPFTWFDIPPGKNPNDNIPTDLFRKLTGGYWQYDERDRRPATKDDAWRDYDTRRDAIDDLANAYATLTPAEREAVEELFREHREPRE